MYLLLRKEEEILLLQRQNSSYYDGWYSVPAGHVEAGEMPIDALIREIKEEIGITLEKSAIKLVHIMYREKRDETGDRVDFFVASKWSGEITNNESHKCSDLQWFNIYELPEKTISYVKQVIGDIENQISYSELP